MYDREGITLDIEKGEATARFGEDCRRVLLVTSEAFVKMTEAFKAFGTVALTLLYMMGVEKGRYDVFRETEDLRGQGVPFTKPRLLEKISQQVRATGWGVPRVQTYDEERTEITIRVDNNPIAVALRKNGKSDRPLCHYSRGYWVGVVSEVLEAKVSCSESKCMSMGDDYCEFKITPAR